MVAIFLGYDAFFWFVESDITVNGVLVLRLMTILEILYRQLNYCLSVCLPRASCDSRNGTFGAKSAISFIAMDTPTMSYVISLSYPFVRFLAYAVFGFGPMALN